MKKFIIIKRLKLKVTFYYRIRMCKMYLFENTTPIQDNRFQKEMAMQFD